MNTVILMGRLVRDPDVRYTASEKVFCRFTLAVDRPWQKDKEKESDFISCVAWGKTAERIGNKAAKGSRVVVDSGEIRTGSYTKKDGTKVYTTDVLVNSVVILDPNNNDSNKNFSGREKDYGDDILF